MFTGTDLTTKLVEYIAAGLPVVTTRLIDAFEVITKEGFGFLVDDSEGWKQALAVYLTDSDLLQTASNAASKYAKKYDEDTVLGPLFDRIFSEKVA
jgi:glycosyltransferase involved in cell wall biosynthesis